jgi:hypothetical protein
MLKRIDELVGHIYLVIGVKLKTWKLLPICEFAADALAS